MNKYAKTALIAARYLESGINPVDAWEKASCTVFIPGSAAQKKGCPKNAFLGLYGGEGINAKYAQKGITYLEEHGSNKITAQKLWDIVTDGIGKKHNDQMHVVIAMFDNGML